jgi:hypothetical protein
MPSSSSRRRILIGLAAALLVMLAVMLYIVRRAPPGPAAAATNVVAAKDAAKSAARTTAAQAADDIRDFRAALDQARGYGDRVLRAGEFSRILQLWLQRDPEAALAYVRALPRDSGEFTQGLLLALSAVGQRDPDRALKLAGELVANREQAVFYSSFFAQLAQQNLPAAVQRLALVPAGAGRENALRAVADLWARTDLPAALTWAEKLAAADRAFALESALVNLVPSDPLRAIQIAQQSLSGGALDRTLSSALHQLASSDPQSAAAIVPLLAPGETQTLAAAEVARALAAKNPADALAWAKTLPTDPVRWLATMRALEVWVADDPGAASRYVASLPADATQRQAAGPIVEALARTNPSTAIAWAQSLSNPETRALALAGVANTWAQRDAAAAARWVAEQPPETFAGVGPKTLNATLSYLILQDAAAAREFVRTLPAAAQAGAAEYSAPLLAQNDPAGTLAWSLALPSDTARDTATMAAFARWMDNAPDAARAWLASTALTPEMRARLQNLLPKP